MTEPFKIGCHCGFTTEQPQALLDHLLTTGHIDLPIGEEDGSAADLLRAIGLIQHTAGDSRAALPPEASIRPVSIEDILTDDDLSDDDKATLLDRLAALRAKHDGEDPE